MQEYVCDKGHRSSYHIPKETEQSIIEMYKNGTSGHAIANITGYSFGIIYRHLRKANLPMRHKNYKIAKEVLPHMKKPKAAKSPMWKGDKVIKKSASIRARVVKPNIPKGMVRHHIDGNPYNNAPENIAIITPKQHTEAHIKMAKERGLPWGKMNKVIR